MEGASPPSGSQGRSLGAVDAGPLGVGQAIAKFIEAERSDWEASIARLSSFVEEAVASLTARIDSVQLSASPGSSAREGLAPAQFGSDDLRKSISRLAEVQAQQEERLRGFSHSLNQVSLAQTSNDRDQKATFRELSNSLSELGCKFGSRMARLEDELKRLREETTETRQAVTPIADKLQASQPQPQHVLVRGGDLMASSASQEDLLRLSTRTISPVISDTGGKLPSPVATQLTMPPSGARII
eukprot:gb/GFBE01056084.1/.p1 GENE.gb/GFBE01056084.1/~~gb/GFBE01056084.1/.p1  ORF type:complete len:243 (+),score=39.28 gb/GFBE01056084.1/:1-729(+)